MDILDPGQNLAALEGEDVIGRGEHKGDGKPLVEGKGVTGFTNIEEEAVCLTRIVPFFVEDELAAKGEMGLSNWSPTLSSELSAVNTITKKQ